MDHEKDMRQQQSAEKSSDDTLEDKPQRRSTEEVFACPFRKRNPLRFNIRVHHICSTSPFKSMALLKRHIKNLHAVSKTCVGVGRLQDSHVVDPEHGITLETARILLDRSTSRVVTWKSLWTVLFPGDTEHPSHEFEAPIEIYEIQELFYNQRKLRELGSRIQRYMQGSSTLPENAMALYFCQMHIIETFHQFRTQRGHRNSAHRMRREEECLTTLKDMISSRSVEETEYSEFPGSMPGVNVSNPRALAGATETSHKGSSGEEDKYLSCPFRKRNPVRFSINTHTQCALRSFQSIALLKRHIKNFHELSNPLRCPRCLVYLENEAEVEVHIRDSMACNFSIENRLRDPEDGVTATGLQDLAERRNGIRIGSWEGIWQLIFPTDMHIPDSEYEPPVEIDEAEVLYYNGETLRRLFHGLSLVGHDEASIVEYMRQHITEVFDQCRAHQGHCEA